MKHLTLVLLFALSHAVIAQGKIGITAKADLVSPSGAFYDSFGGTLGYSFMIHYRIDSSAEVTVNSGFYQLRAKEFLGEYVYTDIPLPLLGFRYYVRVGAFRPYIGAEFGFHFIHKKTLLYGRKESSLQHSVGSGVGGWAFICDMEVIFRFSSEV